MTGKIEICFFYTRFELIRIFLSPKGLYLISPFICFVCYFYSSMLNVTSGHLGNNFTIVHSIILTAGAVGIIFYGLKFLCKYISRLKAEQKIFLNNDKLSHISGGHLIEIEKKYILEIKQTRNFYRLNVSWAISDKMTFHFFRIHFPHLNPYIPRRVTFKTEMVQLASLLNTAYKESSLFNTCKSC